MAINRRTSISKTPSLTVMEYNWGCIFEGSLAALVKAGLVAKGTRPGTEFGNHGKQYRLPLNWEEGYVAACFGPAPRPPIPPAWDAHFMKADTGNSYKVYVEYDMVRDLNIRERAGIAIAALRAAYELVLDIAPEPICQQLGVTARPVTR